MRGRWMIDNTAHPWVLLAVGMLVAALGLPADADIRTDRPLDVRILLDNSGSMWPGYDPGGGGLLRSQVGEKFYWDRPWFVSWLDDFAAAQSELGAGRVSLTVFRSDSNVFRRDDLETLMPPAPLDSFRAREALERLGDNDWGLYTHLAPALTAHSADFEGLVWLITDNVVESGRSQPAQEVVEFFEQLRDRERYRSVHLFKLPAERSGPSQSGTREPALAVYGVLVSTTLVSDETKAHYDRLFREIFLRHQRPSGRGPLFPEQQHRKLKDLRVDALDLVVQEKLRVNVRPSSGTFRENEITRLEIPCILSSNLTQHAVVAGSYRMRAVGPFRPDDWSREHLGLQPLSPALFNSKAGRLATEIPPRGRYPLDIPLSSKEPVDFDFSGFAWLRAALHGVRAQYTGTVEMSFQNLRVDLKREELIGIFGAERVPEIFDVQDVGSIQVTPTRAPITFILESSSGRGLLLLLLLLLIGTPLAVGGWWGLRKAPYRVNLGEAAPTQNVNLRRLGSHRVTHSGHYLGTLIRTLGGSPDFRPNRTSAAVQVESRDALHHQVTVSGKSFPLTIETPGKSLRTEGASGRAGGRPQGGRTMRRPGDVAPSPPTPPPPPSAKGSGKGASSTPPKPPSSTSGSGSKPRSPRSGPKIRKP